MEFQKDVLLQGPTLDTVRSLHQTVVALRIALEESKNEILELRTTCGINTLTLENSTHRRNLIQKVDEIYLKNVDKQLDEEVISIKNTFTNIEDRFKKNKKSNNELKQHYKTKKVTIISPKSNHSEETNFLIKTECLCPNKYSNSLEDLTILNHSKTSSQQLTISRTLSYSNISSIETSNMSDDRSDISTNEVSTKIQSPLNNENDELDDIELIFTTEDTKDSDFKEHLVSLDADDASIDPSKLLQCPVSDLDINLDVSDKELDDDVFNDNVENEKQEHTNVKLFDLRRNNSQIYNSKSDNSLNNDEKSLKSYYSYQDSSFENKSLEKDESFDRFEEKIRIVETDISKCGIHDFEYIGGRRNTCPNPIQYRPLLHRDMFAKTKKCRPILTVSTIARKESGVQTDISALPSTSWRSESSLAYRTRLGDNFTTLPSKFPHPGSKLHLSEKTVEARRVLLSDIGFTSMVPELSRSADHLCAEKLKPPHVTTYGQFLQTTDLYSPGFAKNNWTATPPTPSESQSRYGSLYPLSPLTSTRRCSAPVTPSRRNVFFKTATSKIKYSNGSLPELRGDWSLTVDSGDSTESLVEEAENYLRRSIDCIMTGRNFSAYRETKKVVPRRASAPEPTRDNVPPQGWQPFLPRTAMDLKPDDWVKVITQEGKVRGGRVRYVGPMVTQPHQFVGVQLSNPDGYCDGTYNSRRYFQCEPYHGIFVPFKKVIMGWRP